jgi:hypothetical protein
MWHLVDFRSVRRGLGIGVLALAACDSTEVADGPSGVSENSAQSYLTTGDESCKAGYLPTTGKVYDQSADCISVDDVVLACYLDISPDAYGGSGSGCYLNEESGAVFVSVFAGPSLPAPFAKCDEKYWKIQDSATSAPSCGGEGPAVDCDVPVESGVCPEGCVSVVAGPWDPDLNCVMDVVPLQLCASPPEVSSSCLLEEKSGRFYFKANGIPEGFRECETHEVPNVSILACN